MRDDRTIAVYDRQTDDYIAMMDREAAQDPMIAHFVDACPDHAHVLDLGCGAGHYAKRMAEAGFTVDALDASTSMIHHASQLPGVCARQGYFEDLSAKRLYDGIWAYFSLLHATRDALPAHIARIKSALKPKGVFFLGMKRGCGQKRDRLDRYYEYYEQHDLEPLLQNAGFTIDQIWLGKAAGLAGHPEGWIVIKAHG